VVDSLVGGDASARFADDDRQLALVVELGAHVRHREVVGRADEG
jgi:hypothetical protein